MSDQPPTPEEELERKARRLEELRQFVDETTFAGDERESIDELSVVDQHPSDVADQQFQRELDYTVKRIIEVESQQIREALQRRREGKYGICANCGRQIDPERLKARPEATLCIDCQRRQEQQFSRTP